LLTYLVEVYKDRLSQKDHLNWGVN